jgi:biotin carboxyl carrier protein
VKYIVDVNGERVSVTLGAEGVSVDGERVSAHLAELRGSPMHTLTVDGSVHSVRVGRREGRGNYTLWINGYRYEVEALDERQRRIRDLGVGRAAHAGPAPLLAPMPGLVVRVLAREGDLVQPGQGLVVVEAMKMENELRATAAGRVRSVHVVQGATVEKGSLLIELENPDA